VIRIQAAPPEHFPWIAQRAGLVILPGFGALEAVDDAGRILGMVGFDTGWPGTVALHIALDHPYALRALLRPGFGIAFAPAPAGYGRTAATITVLSTNERSLNLVRHLGFRHVHSGRDYMKPGVHVEFFEMRREDCRFIPRAMRKAA
jgi:RimJ/RimL family protein N-acetyltransferase